jgi:hypothetical protein
VRLFLSTILSLIGVVALAAAIGYGPTRDHWGEPGVSSMKAIAIICCVAAVIGAIPLCFVARRWPLYIGQAALAGTTLRLLVTGIIGLTYQTMAKPHLASFLAWATIFYMLLLAVETSFAIVIVRKYYVSSGPAPGGMMTGTQAREATA